MQYFRWDWISSVRQGVTVLCLWRASAVSQVVINEVMFDPLHEENRNEYIEIVNTDTVQSVDLHGWRVGDGSDDDGIACAGGFFLLPRQYAVILDPDYFDGERPYEWMIPDSALVITLDGRTFGKRGFSNQVSENVQLINTEGRIVAEYMYSPGNRPGYSDEKIDVYGGDSPDNWADSYQMCGTPGFKNSVTFRLPSDVQVTPTPNPFSPDGDGFEDLTEIKIVLPVQGCHVQLCVYDLQGRLRRRLIGGDLSDVRRSVFWDGRDAAGAVLPTGLYILYLDGVAARAGKRFNRKEILVIVRRY